MSWTPVPSFSSFLSHLDSVNLSKGDIDKLKYWLEEQNFPIDKTDFYSNTVLYYSCLCNHPPLVTYLRERYISSVFYPLLTSSILMSCASFPNHLTGVLHLSQEHQMVEEHFSPHPIKLFVIFSLESPQVYPSSILLLSSSLSPLSSPPASSQFFCVP